MTDPTDITQRIIDIYNKVVHWVLPFKYAAIVICILLVLGIIYFAIFTDYLYLKYFVNFDDYYEWKARKKAKKQKETRTPKPLVAKEFKKEDDSVLFKPKPITSDNDWQKIFARIESGRDMDLRLAIIEADKILNRRFDDMGILGRNMKDKMENLPGDIVIKIGRLSSARRVLDDLLKSDHLGISKDTAKRTVEIYQEAYMNLLS